MSGVTTCQGNGIVLANPSQPVHLEAFRSRANSEKVTTKSENDFVYGAEQYACMPGKSLVSGRFAGIARRNARMVTSPASW
jgi:hypothetical protein